MNSNIFKSIVKKLHISSSESSNRRRDDDTNPDSIIINKQNILILLKSMSSLASLHKDIYNDYTKETDFLKFTIRHEFNILSKELFTLFHILYDDFNQHLNLFEKILRYNEVDFVITCNKQMLSFMDKEIAKSILELNIDLMKTSQYSKKDNNLSTIKALLLSDSLTLASSALLCMQNYSLNSYQNISFDKFLNSNNKNIIILAKKIISQDYECSIYDKMAYLHQVPLFTTISYDELYNVSNFIKVTYFNEAEDIITQGEFGNSIYILTSGEVEILIDNNRVNILESGDYFGEIAIIADIRRTATVRSLSNVTTLKLSTREFKELIYDNPKISFEVMKEITTRLVENSKIH